ncbi:microtubule-associated protein futsch [Episyrphus balteatus]|uniref:microtubule-associated protein futsch n=1 Tax=Episyrphus balteatus TaxID=286459 RepID=UPI0024854B42|nr:microtubule-associated protein futsch [Episyrphus balteatus]
MASATTTVIVDKDASCANDPDFAVICAFLEKFSEQLQVNYPDFKQLQEWLSNTDEVPNGLRDLHIKLMRKTRRTVHECAWESALSKFCFCYSSQDGWEIERFGYKKSSLKVKLRILRELLENQFDRNNKFRAKILTMSADSLRSEPIGRDRLGHSYWLTQDPECNIRIYQEHLDEEIWQVVATNREELVKLISRLKGNEVVLPSDIGFIDEDSSSNSCSVPIEKPPPPEEKDDSQESNQSASGRVPNIKIKLGNKDNGNIATVSNEPEETLPEGGGGVSDGEMEEEKKVKPLVISQSKIKLEISKKRSLDECEKIEPQEVKKQRPTLLDTNREKKLGRYEKHEDDDEEEDENDGDEGEEEEEEDDEEEADDEEEGDEEEDDENSADEGEEEEDDEDDDDDAEEDDDECEVKKFKLDKPEEKTKDSSETLKIYQQISKSIEEKKIIQESKIKTKIVEESKEEKKDVQKSNEEKKDVKESNEEKNDVEEKNGVQESKEEKNDVEESKEEMNGEKENKKEVNKKEQGVKSSEEKETPKQENGILKNEKGKNEKIPEDNKTTENEEKKANKEEDKENEKENDKDGDVDKDEIAAENEKLPTTVKEVPKFEDKLKATVDKPDSDKIESSSEDVEMKEVTTADAKNDDPPEAAEVSEAIEDPPVIVREEGSGAECENGFDIFLSYNHFNDEESLEFSEEIEDTPIFIQGEGSGAECLVGNAKTSGTESKATFFFGQPGCLKLSPVKNPSKSDDSENDNENPVEDEDEEDKESVEKISPEPTNGENHSEPESAKKTPKVSSFLEKKKNKPEAKNGNQDDRRPTRRTIINRKRRLSDDKPEKPPPPRHPSSESETDLNSENLEDQIPDEEEEDIGGKRLKMRSKLVNTEIRKKVEAQRKTATKEETTTSSSGGEEELPRKKVVVKKVEKEPEKLPTPKAKLKQKVAAAKSSSAAASKSSNKLAADKEVVKDLEKKVADEKITPEKSSVATKVNEKLKEDEATKTPASSRSLNKQTKKPHPVEANEESDEEIPKKKQITPELVKVQKGKSPPPEIDPLEIDVETKKAKTPEPTPPTVEEDQSTSDKKERKRRSSEDDPKETKTPSPVVVKATRSSRRGGPPEPAIELPQVKRTRVKAAPKMVDVVKVEAKPVDIKPDVKNGIPKTEESKTNTSPVKEEEVKKEKDKDEDPIAVKEEEPKVKEESAASKTPTVITSRPRQQQAAQKQPATSSGQRRKCHDDVDTKNIIDLDSEGTPVRMSRRIAQLKIREEADRRKMEEIALRNMKAELKKKKKAESKPEDPTVSEPSEHSSDQADSEVDVEVKKKAEKKKKLPGKDGWSSGSEEPDEEEVEEHYYERERDRCSPLFKSDHEFSPESDLEDDSQVVPLKRARTARKEGEEDTLEEHSPDESCQKCGKSDHPEWILLCDKCNKGYHCSCLSPVIFYIPEGDWFCPPCQQEVLIVALENHLKEFDDLVQRRKDEEEEKIRVEEEQRLELEKAAQVKVEKKNDRKIAKKQKAATKKGKSSGASSSKNRKKKYEDDDDRSEDDEENGTETEGSSNSSNSSSSGASGTSKSKSSSATDTDDEPIYKLRKRRQINVSYRLNEYDEMIKSALKKEEDAVAGAGNLGRGKDISNIYDEEEKKPEEVKVEENGGTEEKPSGKQPRGEDSGSDFEPIKRKPKTGRNIKKKHRKLTKLDISSEGDDNDSDEDFKTSSMDDEEEDDDDEEVSQSSDSSLDVYRRRRGSRKGGKKKKSRRAARRSARERRKDRKFIVDDSDCDGSEAEVRPRTKKKRKKDSDYTESETNDDDDDELSENIDSEDLCDDSTDSEASDGAWRPSKRKKQRSNAIARKSPKLKPKMASKAKKTKRYDSDEGNFKPIVSKNRQIRDDSDDDDDDSDDSVDSSRKTRGKRCTYLEDYDDESSDGGIKPGVKRPDTPPEEREKFIKKQEEIKRMLAEKNAEGAKLAATPRLIPIKTGAQRSPAKLDSLSTVPLAVIRQAKVLDIDYLQRKGESISEGDLDESEFDDDDLPDDFNPEDMDEEAIARMVEEDFAQQQQLKLPLPSEVLRKKPAKESEPVVRPVSTYMPPQAPQQQSSTSGLQEPVRKKLPMPTIHPPLLRHGYGPPMMLQNRQTHLPLLQNALSAPLNHPMSRQFPPTSQAIPATNQQQGGMSSGGGGDPNKPRGRRKKITPLRDPLQKQQAAAAASAAAAAASKPRADNAPQGKPEVRQTQPQQPQQQQAPPPPPPIVQSATPGVIKSALSIAQPPQLYKPPTANTQPSVITRMPHLQTRPMMHMGGPGPGGGPPFPDQGPRFYRPPHPQSHLRPQAQPQQQPPQQRPPPPQQSQSQHHRQPPPPPQTSQSQPPSQPNSLIPGNRPPMRHRGPPMPPMSSHHSMRPSFVGGPPPLRPSSGGGGGPPPPISLANTIVRDQGPPRQSSPYSGSEQQYAGPPSRHSAPPPPPHLSPYRPQMYNNPGFPHRGPPVNSSQPSLIRPVGAPPPEYSSPGSFVGGGYGYYPPPLSVPHSAPPPPTASAVPSSVIVSASSLAAPTSVVVAPPTQPVSAVQPQPQPQSQQPPPPPQPPSRPPVSSPSPLIEKPCVPPPQPAAAAAPLPPSSSTTIPTSVIELSRKKLTTLETFNTSKNSTPPPLRESSESRSPYSSNPPTIGGPDDAPDDGSGSPPTSSQSTSEFSGLVSYFSSQHDDLNT